MEKLHTVSKNMTGSWPWLRSSASHSKIQALTIRAARYNLNKIPYEYAVEVANRFEGLDLVNSVPKSYGWNSIILYRRQQTKPSQRNRKARRQSGYLRRLYKQLKKGEKRKARHKGKERYMQLNAEFQRIARRDEKTFNEHKRSA